MQTNQANTFINTYQHLLEDKATIPRFWQEAMREGANIQFHEARFPDGSRLVDHCGTAVTVEPA